MFHSIDSLGISFLIIIPTMFVVTSLLCTKLISNSIPSGIDNCIEGLRGVACISVFVNHAVWIMQNNNLSVTSINYNALIFSGNMGSFGVELFFCITGLLFSKRIKSGTFDISFYKKRIKRLAPAYLVVSSAVLVIFLFQNINSLNFSNDISRIITTIYGFGFFGSGITTSSVSTQSLNAIIWTLPYEWKFYAIIPFISAILLNKKSILMLSIFGLFVAYIDINNDKILWLYFISGFLCSYIKPLKNNMLRFFVFVLMLIVMYFCIFMQISPYGFIKFIIVSLFFAMAILSRPKLLSFKSLSIIGTVSYSIYLIHQPVMNVTSRIAAKILDTSLMSSTELIIINSISAIFTFIFSAIMYKFVEKKFM